MIRKILFGMSLLLMTGTQGVSSDENSILKKDKLTKRVNDDADVLTPSEENSLEKKLSEYEDSTTTQIVIVTVASLDDDISKVGFELGERWGIGQKGKNNGLIVLISIEQRKMFIATGYGLEGSLPDAICKRVIENDIKPHFKNQDYFKGIDAGIDKLISAMSGEYTIDSGGSKEITTAAFLIFVFISFFGCFVIGLILKDESITAFIIGGIVAGVLAYFIADIEDLYLILSFVIGGLLSFVSSLDIGGSGGYYDSSRSGSLFSGTSGGFFSGTSSGSSGGSFGGFSGGGGSFGGGGAGGSW